MNLRLKLNIFIIIMECIIILDSSIKTNLKNFGYSQVMVFPKVGASIEDQNMEDFFLKEIPDTIATSIDLKEKFIDRKTTYRFFKNLGICFGYMNLKGVKKSLEGGLEIAGAASLSPIRPLKEKIVKNSGKFTWGLEKMKIKELWEIGLTGKGVKIGHLDTGVDRNHPALKGKTEAFMETSLDNLGTIIKARSTVNKAHDSALRGNGHGTHTAGIICGGKVKDMSIGVAPGSSLCSAIVMEGGEVTARIITGMDWAIEQKVKILNISLGIRGYTPVFIRLMKTIRQYGILPIVAIGNEGKGTSRSPGNYKESFSVGALDKENHVADFSSSIKFIRKTQPIEPDVVAPGVDIISSKAGGGLRSMDGTSQAAPFVTGVAALLFESSPNATIEEVEKAIQSTSKKLGNHYRSRCNYGLIDPILAEKRLRSA